MVTPSSRSSFPSVANNGGGSGGGSAAVSQADLRQRQQQQQQQQRRTTPPLSELHHYAQQMNNSAAACIRVGLYGRAEASLKRALTLSKSHRRCPTVNAAANAPAVSPSLCACYDCSLEGCIVRSSGGRYRRPKNGKSPTRSRSRSQSHPNGSYIYRTPITVTCQGHTMGPALCLAITFNLALTHHLIAIDHHHRRRRWSSSDDDDDPGQNARKARDLYRLTLKTQAKFLQHAGDGVFLDSIHSVRFELILLNNLSHVCGLANCRRTERDRYLWELLSATMVVVDRNLRVVDDDDAIVVHNEPASDGDTTTPPSAALDGIATETAAASGSSNSNNNNSSSSHGSLNNSGDGGLWRIDLDGFLENTAHLVLRPSHTPGAA